MYDFLSYLFLVVVAIPFVCMSGGYLVVFMAVAARGLGLIGDKEIEWLGENM